MESINDLRKDAQRIKKRKLSFGVSYLDEALSGIHPGDLIVVGASTGVGKTELMNQITQHNAVNGKRVLLFALESELKEIQKRTAFRLGARKYFSDKSAGKRHFPIHYRDYYDDSIDEAFHKYVSQSEDEYQAFLSKVKLVYREKEFGVTEFCSHVMEFQDDSDLIILDHIGYFDSDDENEIRATSAAMKKIRDVALLCQRPIIVVSHLRKKDKFSKSKIPDIHELHGTSNISKIATKIITMAPNPENAGNYKFGTLFRIGKCRIDGSVVRYVADCAFDVRSNSYDKDYCLFYPSVDGSEFKQVSDSDLPHWAVSIRKPKNNANTGDVVLS